MSEMTDRELAGVALAGDERGFRTLVERYAPIVEGYFYDKMRNPADTEDLVQEVFLDAYSSLHKLRNLDSVKPWLLKIARNRLNYYYRSQGAKTLRAKTGVPRILSDSEEVANAVDPSPGPSRKAQASESVAFVSEAIGRLGDKYRIILHLSLRQEQSSREIAEHLGLKESTVRMRLFRGLRMVRTDLRRRGISFPEA